MYFPYLRGKQYELISVRENAALMAAMGFMPIIEPVRESLNSLKRALNAVHDASGRAILIVNPHHGYHSDRGGSGGPLEKYAAALADRPKTAIGVLLKQEVSAEAIAALCHRFADQRIALVHGGFSDPGALADRLGAAVGEFTHVFLEKHCGKLYRRHFRSSERVLVRDGFERRVNRKHPLVEAFSDLHITYEEESVEGFGDFLMVGDDFFEKGGPAYAVAIHLTFIDSSKEKEMFIYHFKSDRVSTPTDPAGKFAEALDKLVKEVERPGTHILRTKAVEGFLDLHRRKHFPGLGSVKKLSMNHHIETLAHYFQQGN